MVAQSEVLLIPKLRRQIAEFLQHSSLKRLGMLYQSTCVGLGYGLYAGAISWDPFAARAIANELEQLTGSVTTSRPRNIDLVPIDYGFRPRLRGRLTLRRLALRRNPWTFGGSVSHTPVVTHVSIRTSDTSRCPHGSPFAGLRNAPLQRALRHTRSFGRRL